MFSPRVWSGKPYRSKQIIIGPDIEIKNEQSFELIPFVWWDEFKLKIDGKLITDEKLFNDLVRNDGLSNVNFLHWFGNGMEASSKRKPFDGQIICWNKNVNY